MLEQITDIIKTLLSTGSISSYEIEETMTSLAEAYVKADNILKNPDELLKKEEPEQLVPAVPVKKSVQQDYLVCLEDGKKLKLLKRHLKTAYNMTPEEYRHRWGLPAEYPMVAPSYSAQRSLLAKDIGLGIK